MPDRRPSVMGTFRVKVPSSPEHCQKAKAYFQPLYRISATIWRRLAFESKGKADCQDSIVVRRMEVSGCDLVAGTER